MKRQNLELMEAKLPRICGRKVPEKKQMEICREVPLSLRLASDLVLAREETMRPRRKPS